MLGTETLNKLLKFTPDLRPSAGQPTLRFGCPLAKRYVSTSIVCNRGGI